MRCQAVVVTVVDAFLTISAFRASSTEQKGIASSGMLRNSFRDFNETIDLYPLQEGES